jgi:hypothetical protein
MTLDRVRWVRDRVTRGMVDDYARETLIEACDIVERILVMLEIARVTQTAVSTVALRAVLADPPTRPRHPP